MRLITSCSVYSAGSNRLPGAIMMSFRGMDMLIWPLLPIPVVHNLEGHPQIKRYISSWWTVFIIKSHSSIMTLSPKSLRWHLEGSAGWNSVQSRELDDVLCQEKHVCDGETSMQGWNLGGAGNHRTNRGAHPLCKSRSHRMWQETHQNRDLPSCVNVGRCGRISLPPQFPYGGFPTRQPP